MRALDVIVGRRTIPLWTQLDPDDCRRRLAGDPDLPFTASEVAPGEFSVAKIVSRAARHSRHRQFPPVVHAELIPAERGTSVIVEGRMSYAQLAKVVFTTLFLCAGIGGVFIIPAIENGRPLGDLTPVFAFLVVMVVLYYLSSLIGALTRTRDLAQHLEVALTPDTRRPYNDSRANPA
jgi:hypothetical protein